jgi:hypothetical protein
MRRFAISLTLFFQLALGLLLGSFEQSSFAAPPAERPLAAGVLTTIPPSLEPNDTVSTHDVIELRKDPALQWNPEFLANTETLVGMSDRVKFRREIYCLEFSFKPLRMVEIDVPTASAGTQRKQVWYLVYRVRNTGQTLKPVEGADGVFSTEPGKGGPVRFMPEFVLQSRDRSADGKPVNKSYLDRVIPGAVAAISRRERLPLLNSVEIAEQPIPVSDGRIDRGVWGVATWVDVDPRIDFFTVDVGGLTNAYQWTDNPGAYKPGDTPGRGRRFTHKFLQLNFWRPGDELEPTEQEFRYGVPLDKANLYDVGDGVAYRWVYR